MLKKFRLAERKVNKSASKKNQSMDQRRMQILNELQDLKAQELKLLNQLTDCKVENDEDKLTNEEIKRYSRQLLLPEWSVKSQIKLSKKTKGVLVVGAGGLGCPAIQFMAAAGLSPIGVVDYDTVDVSNLHRQVLHSEAKQGMTKVESIVLAVQALNSHVKIVPYHTSLDSSNALEIINQYDVILDASDNVATRYLLNDACVLAKKPLVSGSALRFEGQLTVYNYQCRGPTYRCLFPEPPPPETVTNCSDGGVVGVVPGIIGSLQAQEAMKIIAEIGQVLSGKLLLFDALSCRFTTVKLRPRSDKADAIEKLIDYEQFCGAKATDKDHALTLLTDEERISVEKYQKISQQSKEKKKHLLIDVRSEPEMNICQLDQAINVPLSDIDKKETIDRLNGLIENEKIDQLILVCRRGNDSQKAVKSLKQKFPSLMIKDIIGGLYAWSAKIDSNFPTY